MKGDSHLPRRHLLGVFCSYKCEDWKPKPNPEPINSVKLKYIECIEWAVNYQNSATPCLYFYSKKLRDISVIFSRKELSGANVTR